MKGIFVISYFFFCLLCVPSVAGLELESAFGYLNYTEFQTGYPESHIIITSGHGGYEEPEDIPDRSAGCKNGSDVGLVCLFGSDCLNLTILPDDCEARIKQDMYTKEIAILLRDELYNLTGYKPYLVINHLHRSKLDPNREVKEAAQGNCAALQAYSDFHNFIEQISVHAFEKGILFDIHGQTHPANWTEIGYRVTKTRLNTNTTVLNYSSIRSLGTSVQNTISFEQLIRGENSSLGSMMQNRGLKVVPSPDYPSPGSSGYYSGSFIAEFHGSQHTTVGGGQIDAVQLECPKPVRNEDAAPDFAKKTAAALREFVKKYYID